MMRVAAGGPGRGLSPMPQTPGSALTPAMASHLETINSTASPAGERLAVIRNGSGRFPGRLIQPRSRHPARLHAPHRPAPGPPAGCPARRRARWAALRACPVRYRAVRLLHDCLRESVHRGRRPGNPPARSHRGPGNGPGPRPVPAGRLRAERMLQIQFHLVRLQFTQQPERIGGGIGSAGQPVQECQGVRSDHPAMGGRSRALSEPILGVQAQLHLFWRTRGSDCACVSSAHIHWDVTLLSPAP
jgi:hypothetical protein